MSYQTGQVVDVTAGEAAHGGWCVARPDDGPVVFVRHALPGERVLARITDVTARLARAEAIQILAASPDRVEPPCPHARPGGCGGCDWQHAALPAQRSLKAAVIRQQLRRLAGLDIEVTVEPLPGDADAEPQAGLGWRTRVQFAVREDGLAGLRPHRSHDVIDIGRCLIAHPAITELGITGRNWKGVASVEAVVSAGSGERAVIISGPGKGGGGEETISAIGAESVLRRSGPRGLTPLRGRSYLSQHAAGRDWRVSAGAFWQVHPGAADALAGAVTAWLDPKPGDVALDLYCGAGLFAGVLAPAVGPSGTVVGVEADQAAVRDARHNLREWPWARVHRGDVAVLLRPEGARVVLPAARLVVADPPRSGLAREVVEYLSAPENGAVRFAYVSCDPATLARDIGLLTAQGWVLSGLRAFDAFPMTHHVECVASLGRLGAGLGLGALARDVVAETGDAGQQALVFQDAKRLGASLAGVPVLLAEGGNGRRRHPGREGALGDLPAQHRGQAHVRPGVRFVAYRHSRTVLDWQYCQSQRFDTSRD
ncbi:MAG TPA: class I SAM-dependent RNA methyltransferase [Streptosporangiaceae bacterium]